jgi:hypothetical protein
VLPQWSARPDAFQNGPQGERKFYQLQLNHSAKIGTHNITAMGLFSRDENATGSSFANYSEDWVFRIYLQLCQQVFCRVSTGLTMAHKSSVSDYRFEFFPSAAVGWTLTNEKFHEEYRLDFLAEIAWFIRSCGK